MNISFFFPKWAGDLAQVVMIELAVSFKPHPDKTRTGFIVDVDHKALTAKAGLENTLIFLHLPYDKVVEELNLLQQIRFMGKNMDANTRYVETDPSGAPLPVPTSKFVKQYKGFIKFHNFQKVGAMFDSKVDEIKESSALPALVVGAVHSKKEHIIEAVTVLATANDFSTDKEMQSRAAPVSKAMLVAKNYKAWLSEQDVAA